MMQYKTEQSHEWKYVVRSWF